MKKLFITPASKSCDLTGKPTVRGGRCIRIIVTSLIVAALLMSATVAALTINGYINPDKQATLTLSAVGSSTYNSIRKNDTVTLTASVSDLTAEFKDGIYGLTIDINYDNELFSYVIDSAKLETDKNFKIAANPNVNGDGEAVVTLLVYADDPSDMISYIDDNSGIFSLDFTVIGDVTDTADFTPFDWKLADRNDSDTGFELITLNPQPVAETVSLTKITAGDINGDNTVNISDLVAMKKYLVGTKTLAGGELLAAITDTNETGTPDTSDLVWMKQEILGLN